MQMTWQERVLSVVAIVEIFRCLIEAVLEKAAAGGVPNAGPQVEFQRALRLPGSRNDGENPKLYLTEAKWAIGSIVEVEDFCCPLRQGKTFQPEDLTKLQSQAKVMKKESRSASRNEFEVLHENEFKQAN